MPPIKPHEVADKKFIPEPVFDAFNELIVKHMRGEYAEFTQDEAESLVLKKLQEAGDKNIKIEDLYRNKWMEVEEAYCRTGWEVERYKPRYCHPTFGLYRTYKFKKKK